MCIRDSNQKVALKILLPQYVNDPITLRRFRQEGDNSKRLRHPNIVKVFDAGNSEGVHYDVYKRQPLL